MVIILLMIISPGANQVLILQSGMVLGHRAAAYNVLGVAGSMFLHALFAGLGISLLIMQSPGLQGVIKSLGAAYILYLALRSLKNAYCLYKENQTILPETSITAIATEETFSHSFKKGFISNILNVQTTFVFLSIFPQYMNKQSSLFIQSFLLTGIFIGLLFAWYALLIFLIALVRERLLHPNIQISIKAITGLLLFGMGCKIFLR
ncbi:LysE family translocator [Anaerospora sp.]|uniref:LysE family translocator n=1 Tax=Anaerospora sp. TaxID=1960278 RepID=UPI0028A01C0B|nr:LysE family translocator [Anaerospora sp.]MDF2930369.1 homoserine/Threonine efflux protein [Anaerospora sp.]